MKRRSLLHIGLAVIIVGLIFVALRVQFSSQQQTRGGDSDKDLNILVWTGYEEPQLLDAFRKHYGNININYKTFVGGDAMFSLLTQSHGQYDVAVVDPEFIPKLQAAGRLTALDPGDYDFSHYFKPFQHFPLCWQGNKLYAVLVEFGALGLVYNTDHLTEAEVSSYNILDSPKVRGRVAVWDWYLPIMGVLSKS